MVVFKILKNCTYLLCNYSSDINVYSSLIYHTPYRGAIDLDEGRIDVCVQRIITE